MPDGGTKHAGSGSRRWSSRRTMGNTEEAVAALSTLLRLCTQKRDPRAAAVRAELQALKSPSAPAAVSPGRPQDEMVLDDEPLEAETLAAATDGELELEGAVEASVEEELLDAEPVAEDEFAGDLAEADFYIQAGLGDDARAILEAITLASPDHPGAVERLRKLGGSRPAASRGS